MGEAKERVKEDRARIREVSIMSCGRMRSFAGVFSRADRNEGMAGGE